MSTGGGNYATAAAPGNPIGNAAAPHPDPLGGDHPPPGDADHDPLTARAADPVDVNADGEPRNPVLESINMGGFLVMGIYGLASAFLTWRPFP